MKPCYKLHNELEYLYLYTEIEQLFNKHEMNTSSSQILMLVHNFMERFPIDDVKEFMNALYYLTRRSVGHQKYHEPLPLFKKYFDYTKTQAEEMFVLYENKRKNESFALTFNSLDTDSFTLKLMPAGLGMPIPSFTMKELLTFSKADYVPATIYSENHIEIS